MSSKIQYLLSELQRNYNDEFWWRNRILHRIVGPMQRLVYGSDGIDILAEDWDNLLILDACRADFFEEIADLSAFDSYKTATSRASATPEFVQRTFSGRKFGDIVYVNSNPHVSRDAPASFHKVYDLWSDAFSEKLHTVTPSTANEWALNAEQEFGDKRLIVHYNQPHGPYIGDEPLEWDMDEARGSGEALKKGLVTREEFIKAYRENLRVILPKAIRLANELTGKTVITADHGELFGKRMFPIPIRAYAHPMGLRDPALVNVPWAVINDAERKDIVDDGINQASHDSEAINERLRDLGYKV